MHKRHSDRLLYYTEQAEITKDFVLPYIKEVRPVSKETSVLEIGCGEGGNLLPFNEINCSKIVGIDILKPKIENAKNFFKNKNESQNIHFISDDIYNIDTSEIGQFDIIFARDVIEHIHDQERFMNFVKRFFTSSGIFFIGFPPWYSAFGGHQQVCKNKFLSKLPYFHILPNPIYKGILKLFGESKTKIKGLMEIKETGISIERFERILLKNNYTIEKKTLFFINPSYKTKFGLRPMKAHKFITFFPFLRNLFVTAAYYIISIHTENNQL